MNGGLGKVYIIQTHGVRTESVVEVLSTQLFHGLSLTRPGLQAKSWYLCVSVCMCLYVSPWLEGWSEIWLEGWSNGWSEGGQGKRKTTFKVARTASKS